MNKHYEIIEKALHYLHQQRESQPSLNDVAEHCHLSEFHLQRIFSQWAGVSPKRFLQCLNRDYASKCLIQGNSVHDSSALTGLSSSARLHDLFVTLEAVTPGELRSKGANIEFTTGIHSSPFGNCFIALTPRGIHQLAFVDEHQGDHYQQSLQQQWPAARFSRQADLTRSTIDKIFKPDSGESESEKFQLWIKGSPFQFKVWEALLTIPEGRLASYSSVASDIGQAKAARAVGSAVAGNPVAFLIPCHRVIKNIGILGNYRWGETRKQAMVGKELSTHARVVT